MIKKETMTSRQRVINALEHKPVDRYPIDLGMHYSTGISAFAYRDLKKYLGMEHDNIEIIDVQQFLARVEDEVLDRFHIDCKLIQPKFKHTKIWNPRGDYKFSIPKCINPQLQADGSYIVTNEQWGTSMKMPSNGYFFDGTGYDWWEEDEDSKIDRYAIEAEKIYDETDKFTLYCGYGGYYMGDLEFICDMYTDEETTTAKIEALHKWNIEHVTKMMKKCGNHIQGVCLGGDLGIQSGAMIDPKLYEAKIHPYMKKFISYIKENSDYKIFMHSCGAVRDFIPMFIDEGIDALNPVQVTAAGMEPNGLKNDFGDKIAFWGGGCNTQFILNMANVAEVRKNVAELTSTFKQNSGFVFNQVHNIMGDIKTENIVAMLDGAYENSFTK